MVRHVRTMANVFPVYMISNVNAMLVLRAQRVKVCGSNTCSPLHVERKFFIRTRSGLAR